MTDIPVHQTDEELILAATQFVQRIGIRPNLRGYHYLITAIVFGRKDPKKLRSLSGGLYPAVAEYYGISAASVERNIRGAVETANGENPDRLQSVFYYQNRKPYVSEILALATEMLQLDLLV